MLTKAEVAEFLKNNGIESTDTVLMHTSMRALGEVDGGCDGLIDAFKEYLSGGLLIIPTHTWDNVNASNPVFEVTKTKPCIGALPTVAAFRRDGVRSLHPTHSVAAFGRRANELVKGEQYAQTPCPSGGVWRRLYDEKAKILLVGVGLNRNTYIHAVDEEIDLPGRISDKSFEVTVIDESGNEYTHPFSPHGNAHSENFGVYEKAFLHCGVMKISRLGKAEVRIFDAQSGAELIKHIWKKAEYDINATVREIPSEYYEDFR